MANFFTKDVRVPDLRSAVDMFDRAIAESGERSYQLRVFIGFRVIIVVEFKDGLLVKYVASTDLARASAWLPKVG